MNVKIDIKYTKKNLIECALGKDNKISRGIAINKLLYSNIKTSASILNKILSNDADEKMFRKLAATNLWKVNTRLSYNYLLKASKEIKDPEILIAIVKVLGRVGDKKALSALKWMHSSRNKLLVQQAEFASSLISYRHNLRGNEINIPEQFIDMPDNDNIKLNFVNPEQSEKDIFKNSILEESYGIEFSEKGMFQYTCPGGVSMLAFNKYIFQGNSINLLMNQKNLLGVLATKNNEEGKYSVSYLILTSPAIKVGQVNILIHRISGVQAWAGTTSDVSSDMVKFKLRTATRIGIVPMELEGIIYADGSVNFVKAVSAGKVLEKRHPILLDIN